MRVLVFGTFDHLHQGHMFLLQEATSRGDLFVVVARDVTVKTVKGRLPDQSEDERQKGIQEVFPSAQVLLGDEKDYLVPIREVKPDLIIMGYDQQFPHGITEHDLPCPIERLPAYRPEEYKSSLLRKKV